MTNGTYQHLEVTFQTYGQHPTVFKERFELGNEEANVAAALDHARRFNARILPEGHDGSH